MRGHCWVSTCSFTDSVGIEELGGGEEEQVVDAGIEEKVNRDPASVSSSHALKSPLEKHHWNTSTRRKSQELDNV